MFRHVWLPKMQAAQQGFDGPNFKMLSACCNVVAASDPSILLQGNQPKKPPQLMPTLRLQQDTEANTGWHTVDMPMPAD